MTEKAKKMTKQEQRKYIRNVLEDNFYLANACKQLLDEGVDMNLILREAKRLLTPWVENYHLDPSGARYFMISMVPFWRRGLTQEETLNLIEDSIKDEAFFFFLYKKAPDYGMRFDKKIPGKYLLINFTRYTHYHFEMLVEGFELSSDDILDIIVDPSVVATLGITPRDYEMILEDCLDSKNFEYDIDDIAERYISDIGYETVPIWLVEVMAILLDNGATVIDIDEFGENVLKLKEEEGVNWKTKDQGFYEDLLEKYGADYRLIEALMADTLN